MESVNGIFSDQTYEEQEEPEYNHDEKAVGGDTSIEQVKAILTGTTAVAAATASGVGAAAAGVAVGASGLYKAVQYGLDRAGTFDIDQKIEDGEPHLDSEEAEPMNSLTPYLEEK